MRSRLSPPQPSHLNDFVGDGHSVPAALQAIEPILNTYLSPASEAGSPKSEDSPESLRSAIASIDLNLPVGALDDALDELRPLWLDHVVRYDSPRYLAHLNCPITSSSFTAAILSAGLNTAVESWDQAKGAALIEDHLITWLASTAGMSPKEASGVFTSGGTQSNLQALFTAREKATARGTALKDLAVACSAEAHHSISRSAHILGLSADAIYPVATDDSGAIIPSELSRTLNVIQESGRTPMCVVLTAGTTDLGAIDPLPVCISAARRYEAHVHVDCAYGGALLLSPTNAHLLTGLEKADTFSVDFHKSFFQPVACSALIYRQASDLRFVTWHAEYLNPGDDPRLNLADRSLQTTRRFDALKLWLTLRTSGPVAIGSSFDICCALALRAAEYAMSLQRIEVLHQPTLSTLLFRYVAPAIPEDELDELNDSIRRYLFDTNQAIIASTHRRGKTYLKFTLLNPSLNSSDVNSILDLIQATGDKLN
ncbi:MAG TPA: pyridoxal-dependent decarboxylase, partial [Corynebacterium kroppenstedtii]|nr:pyridoxal-dependent decarboxylase [Corynebacterium kroppenstedtii]